MGHLFILSFRLSSSFGAWLQSKETVLNSFTAISFCLGSSKTRPESTPLSTEVKKLLPKRSTRQKNWRRTQPPTPCSRMTNRIIQFAFNYFAQRSNTHLKV